jgi:hypothetical protein
MRTMPPITEQSRQADVLDAFAAHMQKTREQGALCIAIEQAL